MKSFFIFAIIIACLTGCATQPERNVTLIFAAPANTPSEAVSRVFFDSQHHIINSVAIAQRVASAIGYTDYDALKARIRVDSYPAAKSIVIAVTEPPGETDALAIAVTYAEQYRIWHEETSTTHIRRTDRTARPVRETIVTNNLYPVIDRIVLDDGTQIWPKETWMRLGH